jgi:hypothetical protein
MRSRQEVAAAEAEREAAALASLDDKLRLVADLVAAVVGGYSTGLFLYGGGGVGKSFSVLKQLALLKADYRVFNSRMTAKGLYLVLENYPDAVHVLEDMERLTNDRDAQGVLRSALWSQGDQERTVTWVTAEGEQRFGFRGGVIMLSNRPLANLPELQALATRISVFKLEVSDVEMAAQMRRIARNGWSRYQHRLDAEQARAVAEYLIHECRAAHCPLDLRLLDHAASYYLLWESGHSACHWHDLVSSRVRQAACPFKHAVSNLSAAERQDRERDLVRNILGQTEDAEERLRLWTGQTGKGKSTFYTRKRQVEAGEFDG